MIFALKQSLDAYEFFHKQIIACEEEIEKRLKANLTQMVQQEQGQNQSEQQEEVKKDKKSKGGRGLQKKTEYNRSPYHFDAAGKIEEILGIDLTEIPGFDANTVIKIIGEIGTDMSRWPTVKHFASWLGLCPGNKISGGKVLSSRTKASANQAAQALRLAANVPYRSKTALGACFRRMRARLGAPKAITATAHRMARILYNMIKIVKAFWSLDKMNMNADTRNVL